MSLGVALVATLLNEEKALAGFLDSVLSQTRYPQEIILVDGGSSDRSCEIIRQYIEDGAPIRLVVKEGANRSQGRNTGIKESGQPIIAMCDVGCRLEEDWLEKIIAPLKRGEAEVAGGYYLAEAQTLMERAVAAATVPTAAEVNPETFLPSSRSLAFLKEAWEKAGGYPEWSSMNEDTLFDVALKKAGGRFSFVPEAIVHWRQQRKYWAIYCQFYRYARGDGEAGLLFGHYRKVFLLVIWLAAVIWLGFLEESLGWHSAYLATGGLFTATVLGYIGRYILRSRKRGWDWPAAILSPVVMTVVDEAHLIGYLSGLFARKKR